MGGGNGRGRGRGGRGRGGRRSREGVGFQSTPPTNSSYQGGPPAPPGAGPPGIPRPPRGEGADAEAANIVPQTHAKIGIIGMCATVVVSTCQNGTPAPRVPWECRKDHHQEGYTCKKYDEYV